MTCEACGCRFSDPQAPAVLTTEDERVLAFNVGWRWDIHYDEQTGEARSETLQCPSCRPRRGPKVVGRYVETRTGQRALVFERVGD